MTGTGTQADPYIPTTLTEFITAVGTARAYVALTQDINAADDLAYTGYLGSAIVFLAAELQGNWHTVRGITVIADNFLYNSSYAYNVIQKVYFLDCAHKGNGAAFWHGGNNYWFVFRDVIASIKRDGGDNAAPTIASKVDFGRCALDVVYTGRAWSAGPLLNNCSPDTLTLHISGLESQSALVAINNASNFIAYPCGIIFDRCNLNSITIAQTGFRGAMYAAFRGCTFDSAITCGSSGGGNVVAIDETPVTVNLSSGWTRATLDQMKDQDWLTSVGFLP